MTESPVAQADVNSSPAPKPTEIKVEVSQHTYDNLSRKAEFFGLPLEELCGNILLDYLSGSVGRPHISAPSNGNKASGQVRLITGPSWQTKGESNAN